MDTAEIQARATIAAALILSRAVELPTVPLHDSANNPAAARLRDLTDYVYRTVTTTPAVRAATPPKPA